MLTATLVHHRWLLLISSKVVFKLTVDDNSYLLLLTLPEGKISSEIIYILPFIKVEQILNEREIKKTPR